jgi:hypothetical protein
MPRLIVALSALLLCSSLAEAKSQKTAPKKPVTEEEKEWASLKYYRTRHQSDVKVHAEEKDKEQQIRQVQNLPVAKDGLPVLASNPDGTAKAAPTPVTTGGGVAEVVGPVDAASAIAAEKKKIEDEKKAKEIEAAKSKLLGADQRDDSGQVIDEDPTSNDDEGKKKRGLFRRKKKAKEEEQRDLDEE